MMKFLLTALLAIFPFRIAGAVCTPAPLGLRLGIPSYNDNGAAWAQCIINDLLILNANGGGGGSGGSGGNLVLDNLISFVDGSTTTFHISTSAFNANSIFLVRDGLLLSNTSDYTYIPPTTIKMATSPASNTTSFYALYFRVPLSTDTNTTTTIINGGSILISSGSFTTVTFIQLSLPYTDANYTLDVEGIQNTAAARYSIRLNNDPGAFYDWTGYWHDAQNAVGGFGVSTYADSRGTILPYFSRDANASGQRFTATIKGIIPSDAATQFIGTFEATAKFGAASSNSEHAQGEFYYNNTSVTTIKISASAGTFTGKYWLTATR